MLSLTLDVSDEWMVTDYIEQEGEYETEPSIIKKVAQTVKTLDEDNKTKYVEMFKVIKV